MGEAPIFILITSCSDNKNKHKYLCESNNANSVTLRIYNVQRNDSGVYYCAFLYVSILIFANGTTLIAGDSYTGNSSVQLLGPSHTTSLSTSVQLACVVRAAHHTVHVAWVISGTPHKGRMIAMEEPGGTWTFLNHITVPTEAWPHGESLTCEVWFNSSGSSIHRIGPHTAAGVDGFASRCSVFLRPVLTLSLLLLLILSAYLSCTFMRPGGSPICTTESSFPWPWQEVTPQPLTSQQFVTGSTGSLGHA
ncbi:immunoglobulin alpha-2 heavy chain-like [Ascaphus truei]|uniref:immunoglobulin alpha-2 heavy chain-like n=1 Tax=Ascaphus truei TaxID=8439 RepID=UPI003F5A0A5E